MNTGLLWTCCAVLFVLHTVCAAPLSPESVKSGEEEAHHSAPATKSVNLEEKVRETVHKAEQAASLAAQDSVRHGHKAETRVTSLKDPTPPKSTEDKDRKDEKPKGKKHPAPEQNSDEESHKTKRVKEHRVNQKPRGYGKMGDLGGSPNPYKEDTNLEDRLAMEAEEEKKYENGEGYGGGGGENWGEGGSKGANWESNIQRQDAAEKQSIQAQVASESAHELDDIQRAITAEAQSSRGSATMGNSGATVVQVGRPMSDQGRMQAQARQETTQTIQAPGGQMDEAQGKSLEGVSALPNSPAQFGEMMNQGQSFGMPAESPGRSMSQGFTGMNQGSLGGQSMTSQEQGANELSQGSLGGALTGGFNRGSLGGALTGGGGLGGGAIEAGGLGGGSLPAGAGAMGVAADGGAESSMSRMMGGAAESPMSPMMGGTAESPMSPMMGGTAESPMSRMMGGASESPMSSMMGGSLQNMASLMGQQPQGSMMQTQEGMMQPQGMPGGAAAMVAGGAGAFQPLGLGGQFAGAQQMAYKKSTIPQPDNRERSKAERVKVQGKNSKHSKVQKAASGSHNRRGKIQHEKRQHKDKQAKDRKNTLPISHHSKHH